MGQIFVAFSEYLNFKVISSEKYYTKMFDTQQEDRNVGSGFYSKLRRFLHWNPIDLCFSNAFTSL